MTEPRPGGGEYISNYFYTVLDQLGWVDLIRDGVTQTRDFNYDNAGRLEFERNPESGQTHYEWNPDGTLKRKWYDPPRLEEHYFKYDDYKRLEEVRYYDPMSQQYVPAEAKFFTYDEGLCGLGRLTSVKYGVPTGGDGAGEFTESYTYTCGGLLERKTIQVKRRTGSSTKTGSLTATFGYDSGGEGRLTSITYPNGGGTYTYELDSMKRPQTLKDPNQVVRASDAVYDAAGRLTQLKYASFTATWQFNVRGQLKRLKATNYFPGITGVDLEYGYTTQNVANNGRLRTQHNHLTQENLYFDYDELNRLRLAEATDWAPEALRWGQSFTYDGFGNLTDKTVTKGSAPSLHVIVDKNTNRITGSGYEYNSDGTVRQILIPGEWATLSYTPDTRLRKVYTEFDGNEYYVYAAAGDRVWKKTVTTTTEEKIFFNGPDGRRLGEYKLVVGTSAITFTTQYTDLYFAGKHIYGQSGAIVTDRVGSVVHDGVRPQSYYPYGEEKSTITGSNQDRFATYYRDAFTNFDYAMQRYYHSGSGRFLTPDPYRASGGPADPGSWNRYAYVQGDPVNFNDPSGLYMAFVDPFGDPGGGGWWSGSIITGGYWHPEGGYVHTIFFDTSNPGVPTLGGGGGGGGGAAPQPRTVVDGMEFIGVRNTGQEQTVISDALAFISQNIDPDCETWLTTNGGFDTITAYVRTLTDNNIIGHSVINDLQNPSIVVNAVTGSGAGGHAIVLNRNGSFFNRSAPRSAGQAFQAQIAGINSGSQRQQVFTLLHEFAHSLSAPGFRLDRGSAQNGRLNNDDVWRHCNKTLSAAKN